MQDNGDETMVDIIPIEGLFKPAIERWWEDPWERPEVSYAPRLMTTIYFKPDPNAPIFDVMERVNAGE